MGTEITPLRWEEGSCACWTSAAFRTRTWELRRAGIPFRVIADSAAGGLIARGLVDRVVVGADRIAANGDVANNPPTRPRSRGSPTPPTGRARRRASPGRLARVRD